MRTYETIVIFHPDSAGDAYTELVDKYKGILGDLGASIIAVEEWGNRKLAYIVQKNDRGSYVLFAYEGNPDSIREFERRMRIDDKVIKFQTVYLEKGYEPSGFANTRSEESVVKEDAPAEKAETAPAKEEVPSEEPAAAAAPAAEEAAEAAPATEEAPAEETTEDETA